MVEGGTRLGLLGWLVAGMVAIALVSAGLGVGQTYLTQSVGNAVMRARSTVSRARARSGGNVPGERIGSARPSCLYRMMTCMRVSVSLPDRDVAFLDAYAEEEDCASRSAAVHAAVELLRQSRLERHYRAAFDEWSSSEEAGLWETVTGDGPG